MAKVFNHSNYKTMDGRSMLAKRKAAGNAAELLVDFELEALPDEFISIRKGANKKLYLEHKDFSCKNHRQEFDQIIVSPRGIFNIETKCRSGRLVIDCYGNYVHYNRAGERIDDTDPFKQLNRHANMLKLIVGNKVPIINCLCMVGNYELQGQENSPAPIVKKNAIYDFVRNYKRDEPACLSDEQISEIIELIESHRIAISDPYDYTISA